MELNVSWISSGFLATIIYEVSYTFCLIYIICSAWFLDIRMSTFFCRLIEFYSITVYTEICISSHKSGLCVFGAIF